MSQSQTLLSGSSHYKKRQWPQVAAWEVQALVSSSRSRTGFHHLRTSSLSRVTVCCTEIMSQFLHSQSFALFQEKEAASKGIKDAVL